MIARLAAEPTSELIELQLPEGTSPEQVKNFFDFLYTDIWSGDQSTKEKLSHWLGCSRSRKRDLMRIKTKGATEGDIRLCIARNGKSVEEGWNFFKKKKNPPISKRPFPAHSSIRCHSSILSARSPFLHSLLSKGQDDRLVLDESLLPAAFLSALVHFLYTDELDLGLVDNLKFIWIPISLEILSVNLQLLSYSCRGDESGKIPDRRLWTIAVIAIAGESDCLRKISWRNPSWNDALLPYC